MRIRAHIDHRDGAQRVRVDTAGHAQTLSIAAKAQGHGSSVNGGELLMLALATCYANDLYREAAQLGIAIDAVEVQAEAEFDAPGAPASGIRYRARVSSSAPANAIEALLAHTDKVAEVHNTLRQINTVKREPAWE